MRGRLGKLAGSRPGAACDHVIPDNRYVLMSTGMRAIFADAEGGGRRPPPDQARLWWKEGRLALRLHVSRGRMPASGQGGGDAARGGDAAGRGGGQSRRAAAMRRGAGPPRTAIGGAVIIGGPAWRGPCNEGVCGF